MDGFLTFSRRVKKTINSIYGWIASVLLLVLTLFTMFEIIRRYIFGLAYEWGQDAIIMGMVSAVALYIGVTQIRRSHLVMNAIVQLMHSRGHYKIIGVLKIVVSAIIVLFCGSVGLTGWFSLSYAWERDLTTESLMIALWPIYLIMMLGFCTMAFIAFLQTIEDIISFSRGEHLDGEIELTTEV